MSRPGRVPPKDGAAGLFALIAFPAAGAPPDGNCGRCATTARWPLRLSAEEKHQRGEEFAAGLAHFQRR